MQRRALFALTLLVPSDQFASLQSRHQTCHCHCPPAGLGCASPHFPALPRSTQVGSRVATSHSQELVQRCSLLLPPSWQCLIGLVSLTAALPTSWLPASSGSCKSLSPVASQGSVAHSPKFLEGVIGRFYGGTFPQLEGHLPSSVLTHHRAFRRSLTQFTAWSFRDRDFLINLLYEGDKLFLGLFLGS